VSSSHDVAAHAAMQALMMPATLPDPERPGEVIAFNQTDRNVYAYLVYRAGGGRMCWKTVGEIMADLGIGTRQTVCNATAKLRRAGLIEVKHRRRDSNHYYILDPGHRLYSGGGGNGVTEWQQPPIQDVKETVFQEPQGVKETELLDDALDVKETALLEPDDVKETGLLGGLDVKKTVHKKDNTEKITQGKVTQSARASRAGAAARRRAKASVSDLEFKIFWDLYPLKTGEDEAAEVFAACIKSGTPAADIIAGLERHQFRDDPKFIPKPANWLRRGHWKDKPPPVKRDWRDKYRYPFAAPQHEGHDGMTIDGEVDYASRPH
jgi:hypothetical protein